MTTGQPLYEIDSRNPKEIIIEGLKLKIEAQGNLRVGFDITTDYPSRETYDHDLEQHTFYKRRIVVKKLNNVMHTMGIGKEVSGEENYETMESDTVQGWLDQYLMEISIWSPDSKDRDNIVELVKLWMLELEQEIQAGYFQLPFLYAQGAFACKFIRAYEDVSHDLTRNGPVYIGSLVYETYIPFYQTHNDELQSYKINLIGNIVDCIEQETSGGNT